MEDITSKTWRILLLRRGVYYFNDIEDITSQTWRKAHMRFINKRLTLKIKSVLWLSMSIILVGYFLLSNQNVQAGTTGSNTYHLKSTSTPYKNQYKTSKTYNDKTKQYYMLRSYLERLEKEGGGTLVLTKGTYTITNTLYIPSNVTLKLKDGVKLVKGNSTGTTGLTPTKTLFQFIAPSKAGKIAVVGKYSGESGINIIGEGTASIDLNYIKDAVGIVIGHNSDILIEGITFQKMNGGSFIKIAASQDVSIRESMFQNHKDSETNNKEAIALEMPDSATKGFVYSWSKYDKTINLNITIENNKFIKLERAIGSTKYSEGKYQRNIRIINNVISETDSHALRILNWEKCVVEENDFSNISNAEGSLKAILVSGVKDPTITNNVITASDRAIQIMPWKNTNHGSSYNITYNQISAANKAAMLKNTLLAMGEYIIRYNKTYEEYTQDTEKWEVFNPEIKAFSVKPASEPFQNYFIGYSTYNSKTKPYYMLRSYLEQLEKVGGGTLTLAAGTYEITNTLFVPSHVTIYLEDGVIIKKTEDTGTEGMISAKSIFQLAAPSKSKTVGAYGGYEGETDIRFIGKGTAIIDLNYVEDALGIMFGHNSEVSVSGITFQNMYSGHFIELDASRNITIEDNSFQGHKASLIGIKEAINIDTPDKNTEGFNVIWTNYDCTPNKDVVIRNNSFQDLERAIGTHKYSEGKYHENVQILDNIIENTTSDAIRIINWLNPVIKGNVIKSVNGGNSADCAILASGVIHPIITENTFIEAGKPIQIKPWKNNGGGSEYAITYNEINNQDIILMQKNYLVRVREPYIRVNNVYNEFTNNTSKYSIWFEYITY